MKFKNWSPRETVILRQYYEEEGGLKIQERLPGKPLSSIYAYANYLGFRYQREGKPHECSSSGPSVRYSEHEVSEIEGHYPKEGSAMHKRIPPRKPKAVTSKANRMGVFCEGRMRWTPEILKEAAELACEIGLHGAAQKYGCSYGALSTALSRADYSVREMEKKRKAEENAKLKAYGRWTLDEDTIIRVYYPEEGIECVKRIPHRSKSAVIARAGKLGLCRRENVERWSEKEIIFLCCNAEKRGIKFCAKALGRTEVAVRNKWIRVKKENELFEEKICV